MARQGITQEQVFETAQVLLDEGQTVTVSALREKLGTGSYSTISAHLAKWREENSGRQPSDIPAMPSSVENALRHVWALAWKEAQRLIKTERDGLDAARREIEKEKKDMANEIARLEAQSIAQGDELKKAAETLEKRNNTLSDAQNALNGLKIDNARLDERVKSSEQRAGEFKEELDKLHTRLKEATGQKK